MVDVLETSHLRVHTIPTQGSLAQNCYVVAARHAAEAVLIDPGDDDLVPLEAALTADGARPVGVLLTHGHFDHVRGLAAIEQRWAVTTRVHEADAALVRRAAVYAAAFGRAAVRPAAGVVPFGAGYRIRVGGVDLEAVEVPGHTPGSVCYMADGLAFSGDTLLFETIGRTDLPGGDRDALRRSIDLLLARLGPSAMLLPGHGRAWDAAAARAWWSVERDRT